MSRLRQLSSSKRRGMLTMSVLVALAIAMALSVAWARVIVVERGVVRAQSDRAQAEFLALSGLARGEAQLQAAPEYSGETWQIGSASLGGKRAAMVDIRIEPVAGEPAARVVNVEARYPKDSPLAARRSMKVKVVIKQARGT